MTGVPKAHVLDHGYVDLVTSWGSEEQIIEAARMSTAKGFEGWGPSCSKCGLRMVGTPPSPADYARGAQKGCDHDAQKSGDEKLLKYLWEHKHHTPFEMAGATFEIKAPIFVFREWHRHRTQSFNEMSARYTPLPNENYIPSIDRLMRRGLGFESASKQAGIVKGADELTERAAEGFRRSLEVTYMGQQTLYEDALQAGVPKELARVHLPVGRYSRMRASANLRNWLAFLTLRMAPDAQWEIRQYANVLHTNLAHIFPRTLALFDEGRRA